MWGELDRAVFHFFNTANHEQWMDYCMPFLTELGSGQFLCALGLVLMFMKPPNLKVSGVLLLAGITFSYNICHALKEVVARPRPFLLLPGVNTLFTTSGFSFPSTHTAMAFTAAVILVRGFGRNGYVFYIAALIVGTSRMYLGLHFPSDVAAGALIGFIAGHILTHVIDNIDMPGEA
jgi:undecaprenyl-diphosphatase